MKVEIEGIRLVADAEWVTLLIDVENKNPRRDANGELHHMPFEKAVLRLPSRLLTQVSSTSFINKVTKVSDRQRLEMIHNAIAEELAVLALEETK